jgi:aminoglycoside/choline kinase family phosphotransferase
MAGTFKAHGMSTRSEQIIQFLDTYLSGYEQYPLAGDASFRRYIRVRQKQGSFMLMDAPPEKENIRPFMTICTHLQQAGFSTPKMIAHDEDIGLLLLEDLGDDTFSRLLRADISREEEYYMAAVELLAHWHGGKLPPIDIPAYSTDLLLREVMLFSNWFLPQLLDGEALSEAQQEYTDIWARLLKSAPLETRHFVHRDYHADNLMWLPSRMGVQRVGLLDFQDAVMGDAAYDLVSLLEDARRDVPPALVYKMLEHYLAVSGADPNRLAFAYALLAAQRNSKIVGIFTRLAARDGKVHYLDYLPRVWAHLSQNAKHPELAALRLWLDRYVPESKRSIIHIRKDAQALGLAA